MARYIPPTSFHPVTKPVPQIVEPALPIIEPVKMEPEPIAIQNDRPLITEVKPKQTPPKTDSGTLNIWVQAGFVRSKPTHIEDRLSNTHRRGTMANSNKCRCGGPDQNQVRVQSLNLDDGRRAERHEFCDENGNEVIEIFAEEKRPLKLEKRIIREHKEVVAKETYQTVQDGAVVKEEVKAGDPEPELKIVERLGVVDHAKLVDGDYVRKEEIGKLVADSVLAGMQALMEHWEPAVEEAPEAPPVAAMAARPMNAQALVEKNVDEKAKDNNALNWVMGIILAAQLTFFGYMFFMM